MKKLIFGSIILTLSLLALVNIARAKVERVPGSWDVTGTYQWSVLDTYEHDIVITTQNPDGTFSGTGGYPAGGSPYTANGQTPEVITGQVTGNQITFTTTYAGPYNPGYSVTVSGTIAPDGSMSGSSPWEWQMTSGLATRGNHGQYVSSQENKQEAAQSRIGMPVQSKGHQE